MNIICPIVYKGFAVTINSYKEQKTVEWVPDEGEYKKNLFLTYLYRGRLREYRKDNDELAFSIENETFLNTSVRLDYPTYEVIDSESTWLCFSSWRPYTATYLRLNGETIIPKGVGVYNLLGSFEFEDKISKTLNYVRPRDYDLKINGDAKLALLHYGDFISQPL